jgi:hypothetical protein
MDPSIEKEVEQKKDRTYYTLSHLLFVERDGLFMIAFVCLLEKTLIWKKVIT